jgi:1-acyl-sn-glycerol-3-phosphate acyltransferase
VLYWVMKNLIIGPWLRVLFRPWIEGSENIAKDGPAILVSNHVSFSDSFFLALVVPRHIPFLAKSEYFTGRGIKGWLIKSFFAGVGQVPIDRSGGRASEAALRTAQRILGKGELLGIYPEGTRSPNGTLFRGRTGVARMALESKVVIIPVAMINTFEIQPPGAIKPSLGRVGIRLGVPMDFAKYYGQEEDRFILRSVTDEVMYAVQTLSGQQYVDIYATKAKELISRGLPADISHVGSED